MDTGSEGDGRGTGNARVSVCGGNSDQRSGEAGPRFNSASVIRRFVAGSLRGRSEPDVSSSFEVDLIPPAQGGGVDRSESGQPLL